MNFGFNFGLIKSGLSKILANIIYNMDTFNVTESLRLIDNAGSDGVAADAPMYASNHIDLGATQSVPYGIPNTGGANSFLTYFDVATKSHVTLGNSVDGGSSVEEITNGAFDTDLSGWTLVAGTPVFEDGRCKLDQAIETQRIGQDILEIGKTYTISFDYETEGSWRFAGFTTTHIFEGIGTFTVTDVSNATLFYFRNFTSTSYCYIDNVSVKEILPVSTTYTFTEGQDHSNVFTTTVAVTDADRLYLDGTSPEAIAQLKDGETVAGLSFDLTDIYRWYPCCDDGEGATVNDEVGATSTAIANYTSSCRTTLENTNYGLSKLRIKQGVTGRFTGMADANLIEFTGDGRYVDTGWAVPALSDFTIHAIIKIDSTSTVDNYFVIYPFYLRSLGSALYQRMDGTALSETLADGLHMATMSYKGSTTKELRIFVDGVFKTSGIPNRSTDYGLFKTALTTELPLGQLIINKRAENDDEVAEAYAKAKLIYTTLP